MAGISLAALLMVAMVTRLAAQGDLSHGADAAKTAIHDALLEVGAGAGPDDVLLLDHSVEVILPTTICPTSASECPDCVPRDCYVMDDLDRQALQSRAIRSLSAAFGGARCSPGSEGAWIDSNSEVVIEDAMVCMAQCTAAGLAGGLPQVLAAARKIGRELGQDAMAVAVDGVLAIMPSAEALPRTPQAEPKETFSTGGSGALVQARKLVTPVPTATVGGEYEHAEFWQEHANVLTRAWREYGLRNDSLASLRPGFVEPHLEAAVAAAQANPSFEAEAAVRSLWKQVAPGVWSAQLLVPAVIAELKQELAHLTSAGIPLRRPNGMNRYGIILDPEVGVPTLDGLVSGMVQEYARPIAAMLFPDTLRHSDTTESFVFTIRYKAGEDVSLAEHRDASVATLNLNLNVDINEASNENWSARQGSESVDQYSGSELQFVDEDDPSVHHTVRFEPGMAILHKGSLRHAAKPIETGERQNLIIWLFGDDGQVRIAPYETSEQMSVAERWSSDVVTDSCRAQPNVY